MSDARLSASAAGNSIRRVALPAQDEDVAGLRRAVVAKLTYAVGKDPVVATERDWFVATAPHRRLADPCDLRDAIAGSLLQTGIPPGSKVSAPSCR